MKSSIILVTAALLPAGLAGPYAIVWSSIEGGGGASTGGSYAVSGGVGKSDQPSAGGTFSATGGFWSVVAVQQPGEPRLYIERHVESGTLRVFWPSRFSNHILEESPDLKAESWAETVHPVSDNGVTRSITFTPAAGKRFFRLTETSGP